MAKERTWIDYANLGSNIVQNLQLCHVNQTLAEQSRLDQMERWDNEREDRLRETVFQLDNHIEGLLRHLQAHPCPALALALEIKGIIENQNIKTGSFRAYEDKDRLKKVLKGLDEVIEKCNAILTPDQKADVERCAKYRIEMPALERFIAHKGKGAEIESEQVKLAQMKDAYKQAKIPAWFVAAMSTCVGLIAVAVILFIKFDNDNNSTAMTAYISVAAFLFAVILAVLTQNRVPIAVKEKLRLLKQIPALEQSLQQQIQLQSLSAKRFERNRKAIWNWSSAG